MSKNPKAIYGEVLQSKKTILQSEKPTLELHYTEWSSSYTPTDPIHDSYHQAAYILDKLKQINGASHSMSYWVFTDIFEENGVRTTPFHGGFGLINYQFIKKPAFFAYQFLNRLGEIELKNDDAASWACKNKKGDIQILLWDFTPTYPTDSVNNQVYYKRTLPAKPKGTSQIYIENLSEGKYIYKIYKVGYKINDAYASYIDLGSPSQLTPSQVRAIQSINAGEAIHQEIMDINAKGIFHQSIALRENDVILIVLEKIN